MVSEVRYFRDFGHHRRFEIIEGNLLTEQTDGIVNAANGMLAHGGGVAAAIARAAGEELVREGKEIVDTDGPIPVGASVATTAGQLPFKGVIHTVGPRQGEGREEEKLVSALRSAFELAEQKGWESLSFPAVSSGIFSVPHDICARAYRRAVEEFFGARSQARLKHIRLCLFGGELMGVVLQHLEGEWGK